MKRLVLVLAILMVVALAAAFAVEQVTPAATEPAQPTSTEPEVLTTFTQKLSYCIGLQQGLEWRNLGVEVDLDAMVRGLRDGLSAAEPLLSQEEMAATVEKFQEDMITRRVAELREAAERNEAEQVALLAENKAREGVVELPSGLQYEVLRPGTGDQPEPTDTVTVHYRGTLPDGTQFDSSYGRGTPVTLSLANVIPGWQEALPLMKSGAKWKLWVPADLAYGLDGNPPIGPNQMLIFEVELLAVGE